MSRWGTLAVSVLLSSSACESPDPTTQPAVASSEDAAQPTRGTVAARTNDGFDMSQIPGRVHVVQPGDTLWSLAETYYGHGKHWRQILVANRNRLSDSTDLPVGMKLIIP